MLTKLCRLVLEIILSTFVHLHATQITLNDIIDTITVHITVPTDATPPDTTPPVLTSSMQKHDFNRRQRFWHCIFIRNICKLAFIPMTATRLGYKFHRTIFISNYRQNATDDAHGTSALAMNRHGQLGGGVIQLHLQSQVGTPITFPVGVTTTITCTATDAFRKCRTSA